MVFCFIENYFFLKLILFHSSNQFVFNLRENIYMLEPDRQNCIKRGGMCNNIPPSSNRYLHVWELNGVHSHLINICRYMQEISISISVHIFLYLLDHIWKIYVDICGKFQSQYQYITYFFLLDWHLHVWELNDITAQLISFTPSATYLSVPYHWKSTTK